MLSLLMLAFGATSQGVASDLCASQKPGASMAAVVVMPARQVRDTLVRATVCVVPARAQATKIGSYHGELYFDSTAVSVVSVQKPEGGVRVENTTLKGQVNFAGAAPSGFPGRALVTVVLKLRRAGAQPALRLKMKELNGTDGANLMQRLVMATP